MPRSKGKDMRGLSADELRLKRQSLEKGLGDLRQKQVSGQLEKPHEFKMMRRQIAQINTVENENRRAGKKETPKETKKETKNVAAAGKR